MNSPLQTTDRNIVLPIAGETNVRGFHAIKHVRYAEPLMKLLSLVWTEKGLTVPMVSMNTLCLAWDRKPFGEMEGHSPFGRYCHFCMSAIPNNPMRHTSVSFSVTTLSNGKSSYRNAKHGCYLLLPESLNERAGVNLVRILIRMQWFGKDGKSTSWLDAVLNCVRMSTTNPNTPAYVVTARAGRN